MLLFITAILESENDLLYYLGTLAIICMPIGGIAMIIVKWESILEFSICILVGAKKKLSIWIKFIQFSITHGRRFTRNKRRIQSIDKMLGSDIFNRIQSKILNPTSMEVFPTVINSLIIEYNKDIDSLKEYKMMLSKIRPNKVERKQIEFIYKENLSKFTAEFVSKFNKQLEISTKEHINEIKTRYKFE